MAKLRIIIKTVLLAFSIGVVVETIAPYTAEARAGRGRSTGRSSSQYNKQQHSQNTSNTNTTQPAGMNPNMNPNRGNFMRNMAGGIAGGFLGSMLFSSLGSAAGAAGAGGAGGGGMGILEIMLLAGLAFFGYRWWRNRQQQVAPAYSRSNFNQASANLGNQRSFGNAKYFDESKLKSVGMTMPEEIQIEHATDIFFKIQGAWTRRDIGLMKPHLHVDMQNIFAEDINDLLNENKLNRLENISIRNANVVASWHEGGVDHSSVRFTANMLDYTVNAATNEVLDGSDTVPVKFDEEWTFVKKSDGSTDGKWLLAGIAQA